MVFCGLGIVLMMNNFLLKYCTCVCYLQTLSASLKILDNINVIISTKDLILIPHTVVHFIQAFGKAKVFVNLMTKQNNCLLEFNKLLLLQSTLIKQYGCFKSVHFSKKSDHLLLLGPEALAFSSHCLAKFQPILDVIYETRVPVSHHGMKTCERDECRGKHKIYDFDLP